jgi:hypothetical protein
MVGAAHIQAAHAIPDAAKGFVGVYAMETNATTEVIQREIERMLPIVIRGFANFDLALKPAENSEIALPLTGPSIKYA